MKRIAVGDKVKFDPNNDSSVRWTGTVVEIKRIGRGNVYRVETLRCYFYFTKRQLKRWN